MYNPFFAKTRQLVKEQAKLADSVAMDTAPSNWSAEVQVTPPVRFFVTRANASDGSLGLGSATIEVYRLYDGQRRSESFTVQPGDRIGRKIEPKTRRGENPQPAIDYSTDWYVAAIVDDQNDDGKVNQSTGRNALVIVKREGSEETMILRDPRVEMTSAELRRLRDEAELAG